MIHFDLLSFLWTIVIFLVGCMCGWMYTILKDKNDDERK